MGRPQIPSLLISNKYFKNKDKLKTNSETKVFLIYIFKYF